MIDNLVGGRESNLAQHAGEPGLRLRASATSASSSPTIALFADARFVFHFAGIGDIVPSIEQPIEYMDDQRAGHGARARMRARRRRSKKFVYAASSSCYGLAAVPTREDHPIAPAVSLCALQIPGRAGGVPLASGLRAAGQLDPHLQRLRHARRAPSGAYGAVFGVFLRQKLAGKPFTVVGDGTQRRDFLYVTDVAEAFLRAAETRHQRARSGTSAPATRRSVNRLVELLGGDGRAYSEAAGRARLHLGRHRARSRAISAGSRRSVRGRRRRMMDGHRATGAMRRCGTRSRSPRRPRPGSSISGKRGLRPWNRSARDTTGTRSRRPRNCATLIGTRPRKKQGDHVPRRVRRRASRAMCGICSTPRARPTS